jgi:hypothetical protein
MKHLLTSVLAATLLLAGCQKPGQVIVDPGDQAPSAFDVTNVGGTDPGTSFNSVDSTGLMPREAEKYDGLFLVTQTTYDDGANRLSFALSSVLITNPTDTCRYNGVVIGRSGMDLGGSLNSPILNGTFMRKVPFRLPIPGAVRDTVVGAAYVANVSPEYAPGHLFQWNISIPTTGNSGFPFKPSVQAPDSLIIVSPAGGSVFSRLNSLVLKWKGAEEVTIILSKYNPSTKKSQPLMKFHPADGANRIVIDPKILKLLPADRTYVLSFVSANRQETHAPIGPVQGVILIQSAVVYNTYVQLM